MTRVFTEFWNRTVARLNTLQPPQARRIVVSIVGFTVLALGVLMLALPGPAFLVIPAGLAILALEFHWARRWLDKVKELAKKATGKKPNVPAPVPTPTGMKLPQRTPEEMSTSSR